MNSEYIQASNNFCEFIEKIRIINENERNNLFRKFIRCIFKYSAEYVDKYEYIWLYDEIPLNIIKDLGLEYSYKGIDLILLSKDKKYYYVQCKYKMNPHKYKHKHKHISFTEIPMIYELLSLNHNFDGGFIVTNINEIIKIFGSNELVESSNKYKLKTNKITIISDEFLCNLPKSFFNTLKL